MSPKNFYCSFIARIYIDLYLRKSFIDHRINVIWGCNPVDGKTSFLHWTYI